MLRSTLVLAALSGCDLAFQLPPIEVVPAACGPFTTIEEVAIIGVTEPRQFSVTADGQLAMVLGTDEQNRRRPIALEYNGAAWQPHAMYQDWPASLVVEGVRLAPSEEVPIGNAYVGAVQPAVNLWFENTGMQQVARYYWNGTTWQDDTLQPAQLEAGFDTRAGNVVLVRASADPADRVRHTVLTRVASDPADANQIVLAANSPPSFTLLPKDSRTRPLNEQAVALNLVLGDAVLTENQAKLVYAAVSGGQSDIYASAQSSLRDFAPGGLIGDNLATADDEVEPWIDATCSTLYFRRVPAGSPNAPGTIFVAR